jgi:type 1 fimbriae regulatory protein FimE
MSIHAGSTSPDRHTPTIEKRKVPVRRTNAAYRNREYLTEKEVERLMESAARLGRHGPRDATLILVAYRHGLRVSELISLRWDQVDLR